MQWDTTKNAGFSSAQKTWLPVPPSAAEYNVVTESRDPNSILNFYRHLIALRRSEPALRNGSYVALNRDNQHILSFLRKNPGEGDSVLVVLNMSSENGTINFDLSPYGMKQKFVRPLLASPNGGSDQVPIANITIPSFGVLIGAVR